MSAQQLDTATRSYIIGFFSSLVLTIDAYVLVRYEWLGGWALIGLIVALATAQLIFQLIFFLHLSHGAKPRWQAIVFWFMMLVVVILGAGSVWIMYNMNYHHNKMTPKESEHFITEDEGITP